MLTSEGGCWHGGEEVPRELQLDEICEAPEGRGVDLPDLASDDLIPNICLFTLPYWFTEFRRKQFKYLNITPILDGFKLNLILTIDQLQYAERSE